MSEEKNKRNKPCPCGSGKKYKRCCLNKKPRQLTSYICHEEKFKEIIYNKNGEVLIRLLSGEIVKPQCNLSQTEYERKSGKTKVLNRINDKTTLNIFQYLVNEVDLVLAIDTNTKKIDKDLISIAGIFECYVKKAQEDKALLQCRLNGILPFKNCPVDQAEKLSWYTLINRLILSPNFNKNQKVVIVTDHDLGNHSRYNKREIPIFKDFYLPENFEFVYASSDSGKENLLNVFITECDKCSADILKQLKEKKQAHINNKTVLLDKILDASPENLSEYMKKVCLKR